MRTHCWLIGIFVALALLAASVRPGLAQPRPGPGARPGPPRVPMPMLMGAGRDTELTALAWDIVALRAINSLGMTREQIEKLIPALEGVLAAEKRLREEALRQLRAERARLLAGTATPEQAGAAMAAIAEARHRYTQDLDQAMSRIGDILKAEQMETLKRLVAGPISRGRPARAPEARAPRPPEESKLLSGLPSPGVTEHVIGLLKEKVRAMQQPG